MRLCGPTPTCPASGAAHLSMHSVSFRGHPPFGVLLAVLHQMCDLENQCDRAVAQYRRTGECLDIGMQLGERLDHRLVVADHLIHHQPDALLAGVDALTRDEALRALPTEVERIVFRAGAADG